jgi:hypothetical protein
VKVEEERPVSISSNFAEMVISNAEELLRSCEFSVKVEEERPVPISSNFAEMMVF